MGPILVAVSIVTWPVLLTTGWAMVYYPALGTGVVASDGPTPHAWTRQLRALAATMLYAWEEIEPLEQWVRAAAPRSS